MIPNSLPRAARATLAFTALTAILSVTGSAQAAPAWITIGGQAHALLQTVAPQSRTLASRQVQVTVPAERGSARLVRATEAVHAVEIDDNMIPSLSMLVHRELRKCGGFVQHSSMAEALAVLHRLEAPEEPMLLPSYAIDNTPNSSMR